MKKIGEVGWVEKEDPKCGPMDAIVRPTCISPCTSDIHTVYEGAIGERKDMILGHEAVGIIEEVGDMVENFKVGDRVLVPCVTPDWHEMEVQRGYSSHSGGLLAGWKYSNVKDGSFANKFHVNEVDANVALIPDEVSDKAAVMLTDMWPTGMVGSERANIPLGGSVLVIGIGAVGLSAVLGAKLLGAGDLFAAGTRPVSVEVAKKYGATEIINYREAPIDEQVLELTEGEGVDSVVIAGGNLTNTWKEAIASCKPGGTVSNVNYLSGADILEIPRAEWGSGMSNITIEGGLCVCGREKMERLLSLVRNGRGDPELLVTHEFHGLDKIEDAFALMKDKPKDLIKPVVYVEEDD